MAPSPPEIRGVPGAAVHRGRAGRGALLQSRRGSVIQDRFPDLVAAADAQLPAGLVLDGELLVWDPIEGRLSFEALQRRAAARGRGAPALAARWRAYYLAFDILQLNGQELLSRPYWDRRALLEELFTGHGMTAPWTLCPMTTDPETARGVAAVLDRRLRRREDRLQGHEAEVPPGIPRVGQDQKTGHHRSSRRRHHRHPHPPSAVILGRHDPTGRLRTVGRTVPLARSRAATSPSGGDLVPSWARSWPWRRCGAGPW
ncbi:hypothetical protein AB0P15_31220 [Streptomyces sp. NPDC087917]|uniref:ATP-dependent DNA ligase n=1 Tax=Streptomyces sp. NPDC087917 TaxID=3155060 RepID=UPI00343D46B0